MAGKLVKVPDSWKAGSESFVLLGLMLDVWIGARLRSSLHTVEMPVVTGQSCKVNICSSVDLETGAVCLVRHNAALSRQKKG